MKHILHEPAMLARESNFPLARGDTNIYLNTKRWCCRGAPQREQEIVYTDPAEMLRLNRSGWPSGYFRKWVRNAQMRG